jgi:hypothetical protein
VVSIRNDTGLVRKYNSVAFVTVHRFGCPNHPALVSLFVENHFSNSNVSHCCPTIWSWYRRIQRKGFPVLPRHLDVGGAEASRAGGVFPLPILFDDPARMLRAHPSKHVPGDELFPRLQLDLLIRPLTLRVIQLGNEIQCALGSDFVEDESALVAMLEIVKMAPAGFGHPAARHDLSAHHIAGISLSGM